MKSLVLGLDIGSVSISLVCLSPHGEPQHTEYRFHKGMVRETLQEMLEALDPGTIGALACTTSTPRILPQARYYDNQVCYIEAVRRVHGLIRSLLVVGAERFMLLRFDPEGLFINLKASTSCAAGTGSFLDQQAGRLGLEGSAELAELACGNRGEAPKIASRCAVFAKTDLCHAQQSGYTLEEICDGLCAGLARNISDTISTEEKILSPAVFAGGVSRNRAVVSHLEALLGCSFDIGEHSHLYGALGAALCGLRDGVGPRLSCTSAGGLIDTGQEHKSYYYEPLQLKLSTYPDFDASQGAEFFPSVEGFDLPVEVDLYEGFRDPGAAEGILGIDVGSTSTKAIVIDPEKRVLAGFYTRTAGRPLAAVQAILEALDGLLKEHAAELKIRSVGTTGAGRKFIGEVIGADLILNEITAHARAAYELDPQIDTIIEIGGQDSKFTSMRDGMVSFSQMNTVCAAGTGSFIEEQANKLGVPLAEYSTRAEGVRAPLASDRCTVFMERDINHYLNKKYSVDEILAAVLFSVRENYLLKVSSEGLIGQRICFQGATAKNRALVAAFEQKLKRPIFVSRYCHLTGALGVALALQEDPPESSRFRGLDLYGESIPVRPETCPLCNNHCRLRIAEVRGQTVAYGFLCGRDYQDKRYVSRNRSGFDLLREYRRVFQGPARETEAPQVPGGKQEQNPGRESSHRRFPTIGIPAALHLLDQLPLWKRFFSELGIQVVTSEGYAEALKSGKELTGAEFCAPVTALHGHVHQLARSCDYLFLPVYLEAASAQRRTGRLRHYCYYTQFAPAVISQIRAGGIEGKTLLPLIDHGSLEESPPLWVRKLRNRSKRELHAALQQVAGFSPDFASVGRAYDRAVEAYREGRERLQRVFRRNRSRNGDVEVVLAGRPYQVLSPEMNKGIPDIFAALGIKTYWQDMLPPLSEWGATSQGSNGDRYAGRIRRVLRDLEPLLDAVHWNYAARILETAAFCVLTEGLYPVLITAFKCSPDSFVIEYFKRILDKYGKPYLILQIDEHDSSVGYEIRIEAGAHSFRNHALRLGQASRPGQAESVSAGNAGCAMSPVLEHRLKGKTLLLPSWDALTVPLLAAAMRSAGVDARVLEEDELSIQEGARFNSGQCLPVNAIVQAAVRYVRKHSLDPARTVLWIVKANWSCNIPMFPHYMKSLLERYGGGMERTGVYPGDISHTEIAPRLAVDAYFAHLFGGLLRRLGCRFRPYEANPGETDRMVEAAQEILVDSFLNKRSREDAFREVLEMFSSLPRSERHRPKVAIFGDFYVRDNEVMNQDLIRFIEAYGGEVVTTPFSEYLRITATALFKKWTREHHLLLLAKYRSLLVLVRLMERKFFTYRGELTGPPPRFTNMHPEQTLGRYHVRLEHHGESWDNLLKIAHLVEVHPDLRLFVQTNPAFCCPSLVTEAMASRIEELTGVPVVTLTYDGTGSVKNDRIVPYLAGLGKVHPVLPGLRSAAG
jgi:predicted CoA-substrate-specific enzyme activase